MGREQPEETRLFDSILNADLGEGVDIDLRPALGKMKSDHVFFLVHQWQGDGLITYERDWFLVQLTAKGRRRKEGDA